MPAPFIRGPSNRIFHQRTATNSKSIWKVVPNLRTYNRISSHLTSFHWLHIYQHITVQGDLHHLSGLQWLYASVLLSMPCPSLQLQACMSSPGGRSGARWESQLSTVPMVWTNLLPVLYLQSSHLAFEKTYTILTVHFVHTSVVRC